jgi:hypothetical protein
VPEPEDTAPGILSASPLDHINPSEVQATIDSYQYELLRWVAVILQPIFGSEAGVGNSGESIIAEDVTDVILQGGSGKMLQAMGSPAQLYEDIGNALREIEARSSPSVE